ncbi:hypothetical protein [uncultured Rhodoblastus sp.]|uniref:hypothetical protein n=1 Tax=uncultured Rhodoblastus sp. TaxID=543037 RepID=UPI0025FA3360|nr:hypothetical protein [uncultured Rhodoblastus sp.]
MRADEAIASDIGVRVEMTGKVVGENDRVKGDESAVADMNSARIGHVQICPKRNLGVLPDIHSDNFAQTPKPKLDQKIANGESRLAHGTQWMRTVFYAVHSCLSQLQSTSIAVRGAAPFRPGGERGSPIPSLRPRQNIRQFFVLRARFSDRRALPMGCAKALAFWSFFERSGGRFA